MASHGYITFLGKEKVYIKAGVDIGWQSGGMPIFLDIRSSPLTEKEILVIDNKLGAGNIKVEWSVDVYGLLTEHRENGRLVLKEGFCDITISSDREFELSRE